MKKIKSHEILCPYCNNKSSLSRQYETTQNGDRFLYKCSSCSRSFSETSGSPLNGIRSSISKISLCLKIRSEGCGLRATGRILDIHKNTVSRWESLFSSQKKTLMLYFWCHEFLKLIIEGDELYTIVKKRKEASSSEGWTAIVMDRASRFIIDQQCGEKDALLFKNVMENIAKMIDKTGDITFISDGERRYGNTLFDLCSSKLNNGKPGRPKQTLPQGVKVRVKNKGSQSHKRGPKRKKYQAPKEEHPDTNQDIENSEIHANHVEALNASIRRRNSAFRRRTNTYAKTKKGLQRTLDLHFIFHNFIRPHWTTGEVPSVAIGICEKAMSIRDILSLRSA